MTPQELLATLELAAERKRTHKADFFKPYPKQELFCNLGATIRERLLIAGNQVGKSEVGAFEVKCHLTGEYPEWWRGRKFDQPVKGGAAGETSLIVRDVQQKKLCGEPGVESAFGTGMIPKDAFVDKPSLARGVTDAYDTIQVKHKSGGISILRFKSYEQGRQKFQGETLDFLWFDEEPPEDVYSEGLTRTAATGGMVFLTFTPLKGRSTVVIRFMNEESPDRAVVTMTIDDAEHIAPEERKKIVAAYLPHEREARAHGVPMLGSGRIFLHSEEAIREKKIEFDRIPVYWTRMWAVDFGINHPFAAVLGCWDRDNDIIHILHCIRIRDQLPLQHSVPMKAIGAAIPVAWPQDGTQRRDDGLPLANQYKVLGLKMLPLPAMWPEGGNSTEAGIREMDDRFGTGRLKVSEELSDWFEEYRFYHREDGKIVKINDDLMSATRVWVMAKRFSRAVPFGSHVGRPRNGLIAKDVDFDLG